MVWSFHSFHGLSVASTRSMVGYKFDFFTNAIDEFSNPKVIPYQKNILFCIFSYKTHTIVVFHQGSDS